jgi:RNA polymerase sigma-70 factor, ECF subfamily
MTVRDATAIYRDTPLPDERQLVQKARSGDADAFAMLYDAYVDRIYRYIYFRVSDDIVAEDLTSQVFLKAWESLDRYRVSRSPYLALLYTIARNLVIDYYRMKKETVTLDAIVQVRANGPDPDEEVQNRFDMQAVRDALQFLTEEQQQVLSLRFIAGMSTEDIARLMDKREGAIRALQMRALQALTKYMAEKDSV